MVSATHRLFVDPGFVAVHAEYPIGDDLSGGNVTAWLTRIMEVQVNMASKWGCYYQCTPAVGAVAPFVKWQVDCLYFGNDTSDATSTIAPLKSAWDRYPAKQATWNMSSFSSFWSYKHNDNGGDTTGVAAVLTSRIFPTGVFTQGSIPVLAESLIGAVHKGINFEIINLISGAAGGRTYEHNTTSVSQWMRGGEWHIVAGSGWLPIEPESLQLKAIDLVREYGNELRQLVPVSGAYLNENDWAEPNWKESFYGDNYLRLLAVKIEVDPLNVFICRHCVGSNETLN